MLSVRNLKVVYRGAVRGVDGVDLEVPGGRIVALLGAGGAGKTTVLLAICGLLEAYAGEVVAGEVLLDGRPVHRLPSAEIVRLGVRQVPAGRPVFPELSVADNLRLGGHSAPDRPAAGLDRVYGLFPGLKGRARQAAGGLSGEERQMLAVGRALMSDPRVLLLDEPSQGLAGRPARLLGDAILEINQQGTAVLLAERDAAMALAVADHSYLLEGGRVVLAGPVRQPPPGAGPAGRR